MGIEKQDQVSQQDHIPSVLEPHISTAMTINSPIFRRPIILGDLTLGSPTTQTTVGAAGGASALPATPTGYLTVNIGNSSYVIPYYAVS